MMTIEYCKQPYVIREGWHEVDLTTFMQLAEMENGNPHERFCLAIGLDYDVFRFFSEAKARELINKCQWAFSPPEAQDICREFEFEGVKYRATSNIFDISVGQFASVEQFARTSKSAYSYVPAVIACLFFAEGETDYNRDVYPKHEARAKMFERLPITTIIGVHNFFLMLSTVSDGTTLSSLRTQIKQTKAETDRIAKANTSTKGTGGFTSFIKSRTGILLKKLPFKT